ncbi:FHA domain-containing protein [Bradyrhizobium guangxiense]|uniref:FHA domain-containing protein n=1 Tax=Bradyrhizobium guangxiense TaxID=1325115 RepID=UPI0010090079|nr:FHA domain-containing protein [Bradyrhizobium guangxiense]
MAFALKLQELMGDTAIIEVFDSRWMKTDQGIEWRGKGEGNARRQQVVTIQSRQYTQLPKAAQDELFQEGQFTEMWPIGPDSPPELGPPRNMRIAQIEDTLLQLAVSDPRIQMRVERFSPKTHNISDQHVLVICEGASSSTREFFLDKFGEPDAKSYSLIDQDDDDDDEESPLEDVVLGLLVKSKLPDATAVALTIGQNRFLLNSLNGEGFLNMRLHPEEVKEVLGVNLAEERFEECIQSNPCMMQRDAKDGGKYYCPTHNTYFKPALEPRASLLWPRILDGLRLFGVAESDLKGITAFRLAMVQRPRFCAEVLPPTRNSPGTYGCLLGDAANAIHFWPGRGLNSGLASAFSLAHCLRDEWNDNGLRDASFMRHEAFMAMLQYRHKTRAWRAMTSVDGAGNIQAIKNLIAKSYASAPDPNKDYRGLLVDRFAGVTKRLEGRLTNLPDAKDFNALLGKLKGRNALRVLYECGAWDTRRMGGDEVDLRLLFDRTIVPMQTMPARPPVQILKKSSSLPRAPYFLLGVILALGSLVALELSFPGSFTFWVNMVGSYIKQLIN